MPMFRTLWIALIFSTLAYANPPLRKIPDPQPPFASDFADPPSVEEAAADVARDLKKTEERLITLLQNDGTYFNGQLTLKTLSAMEIDSSPAVRSLATAPQTDGRRGPAQSYLDIYQRGKLRQCVVDYVHTPVLAFGSRFRNSHHSRRDYELRNRISFLLHFLDKHGALLDRTYRQRKMTRAHYQPLRDSVTATRRGLLDTIVALQDYALAYEQLEKKATSHSLWFAEASRATKEGPAFVGMYLLEDTKGVKYLGYATRPGEAKPPTPK